jgi:hypothetical protein
MAKREVREGDTRTIKVRVVRVSDDGEQAPWLVFGHRPNWRTTHAHPMAVVAAYCRPSSTVFYGYDLTIMQASAAERPRCISPGVIVHYSSRPDLP